MNAIISSARRLRAPIATLVLFALTMPTSTLSAQTPERACETTIAPTPWTPPTSPIPDGEPTPPHRDKLPDVPVGTETIPRTPCPETVPINAASPQAPTIYRNTVVKPPGASTATAGSPSTSHLGGSAFMTGNLYAAASANDGSTWAYVNPNTKFTTIDGGLLGSQSTISAPNHNVMIWCLLYKYSAATSKNTVRLAVMKGGAAVGSATVFIVYDINAQKLGYPAGTWIDFPALSRTDKWLYMTGNVYDGPGAYQGPILMRIDLATMAAGGSAATQYYRPNNASPRVSMGSVNHGTRAYFATHNSTTSIRVTTWDDGANVVYHYDRTIPTWYSGMTAQPGPDGRNFLSRCDNRILAGYHTTHDIGFYWTSNLGGPFPRPFVNGVVFDPALNFVRTEIFWSPELAWAYPSTAPNAAGHIGYCLAYGGGTTHAGCAVFMRDDVDCGPLYAIGVAGNAGPANGFGDYLHVEAHPSSPMTFVAACMAQIGGTADSNSQPHNVHFGRTTTVPTLHDLSVSSAPSGAAITVSVKDNYCEQNGTTPFKRSYPAGTPLTLTAPATLGSRQFYNWRLDDTGYLVGQTSLMVYMGSARSAVAVYGFNTTPVVTSLGTGCAGTGGVPALSVLSQPFIGTPYTHRLTNGPVNKIAYLALGSSKTSWPPVALPFTLPSTSCTFYCNQVILLGQVVPSGGIVNWPLTVPNDVGLLGGRLYFQDVNLDLGANLWNVTTSNGLEETVGGWNLN